MKKLYTNINFASPYIEPFLCTIDLLPRQASPHRAQALAFESLTFSDIGSLPIAQASSSERKEARWK